MLCANPVELLTGSKVGCGRCINCRINKRRAWTARILLEARTHPSSSFVTLTYNEESCPRDPLDGTPILFKRDFQLWMKRFRKAIGEQIRYFGVGEYGDDSWRPHYHACVFGLDCAAHEETLEETWGQGFVQVGELVPARAAYCASYTVKKFTQADDELLGGRPPEFALQSRKPGIGVPAVERLAAFHVSREGSQVLAETGDVIREVRMDGRRYPLDETMLRHLRGYLGVPQLAADREAPLNTKPVPTAMDYHQAGKAADKLWKNRKRKRHAL